MKKYTVILLYPDHIASDYPEFYETTADACSAKDALHAARVQAVKANDGALDPESDDYINPYDFACVAVYEGDLNNLNPE